MICESLKSAQHKQLTSSKVFNQ